MTQGIDFRKHDIEYLDFWRGGIARKGHFIGKCIVCGRKTFEFDDGENDPRGPLGDHASSAFIANEYGYIGDDVPLCFLCGNDTEAKYKLGLWKALKHWKAPKDALRYAWGDYCKCLCNGY